MPALKKQGHPLTNKVVLDAMGGDHAPHAEIDGALAATRDLGIGVILVGQRERLSRNCVAVAGAVTAIAGSNLSKLRK